MTIEVLFFALLAVLATIGVIGCLIIGYDLLQTGRRNSIKLSLMLQELTRLNDLTEFGKDWDQKDEQVK